MAQTTTFVPQLIISHGITDINFYFKAFAAKELRRWSNEDGSIHVAELEIDGALFHLHEEGAGITSPAYTSGTTVIIGLMVEDVYAVFNRAIAAGAAVRSPVKDYDYNYRQGDLIDPFGHHWLIQKKLN